MGHRDLKSDIIMILVPTTIIMMLFIAVMTVPNRLAFLENYDKLIHFVEFLIFGYLLILFLTLNTKEKNLIFVLITILVAGATEAIQLLVPGRTFSVFDMISDFSGAFIGFLLFLGNHELLKIKRRRRKTHHPSKKEK